MIGWLATTVNNNNYKESLPMQKKILSTTLLASSLLLVTSVATAENSDFAITPKLGTLGAGLDITYAINKKLNARVNVNGGTLNADDTNDGVHYKGDLKAQTIGGLVDYHPTGGGFRISAGLYNNSNELNLTSNGAANSNVMIGDRDYDLTNAKLEANIGFNSAAPYLGLGWGNSVKEDSTWNISLDAGILFQGTAKAKLKGTGTAKDIATGLALDLATDATFQSELAKEEDNLNNDLKDFKAYPVIALGVSYQF